MGRFIEDFISTDKAIGSIIINTKTLKNEIYIF